MKLQPTPPKVTKDDEGLDMEGKSKENRQRAIRIIIYSIGGIIALCVLAALLYSVYDHLSQPSAAPDKQEAQSSKVTARTEPDDQPAMAQPPQDTGSAVQERQLPEFMSKLPTPLKSAARAVLNRKPKAIALLVGIVLTTLAVIAAIALSLTFLVQQEHQIITTSPQHVVQTIAPEPWYVLVAKYWMYWVPPVAVVAVLGTTGLVYFISTKSTLFFFLVSDKFEPAKCYSNPYKKMTDGDGLNHVVYDDYPPGKSPLDKFLKKESKRLYDEDMYQAIKAENGPFLKTLFFVSSNITQVPVDAIVNASNRYGDHGKYVSGSIHAAVGYELDGTSALEKESKSLPTQEFLAPYPLGTARAVVVPREPNYTYKSRETGEFVEPLCGSIKVIIHATGPRQLQVPRRCYLARVYFNLLVKIVRLPNPPRSVAIPAISSGRYAGNDKDKLPVWVLETVRYWHNHVSPTNGFSTEEIEAKNNLVIVFAVLNDEKAYRQYSILLYNHFLKGWPEVELNYKPKIYDNPPDGLLMPKPGVFTPPPKKSKKWYQRLFGKAN